MSNDINIALAVPADLKDKANLLACAVGHDALPGNTYSIALSADGSAPATHFACHAWVQQAFMDLLAEASQGQLPPVPWEDFGLTEQDVFAVLAVLIPSDPSSSLINFREWAATKGLYLVVFTESEE